MLTRAEKKERANHQDCLDGNQGGEAQWRAQLEDRVKELVEAVRVLRAALKPFAGEAKVNEPGKYTIRSDRPRPSPIDIIRAKRVFDETKDVIG